MASRQRLEEVLCADCMKDYRAYLPHKTTCGSWARGPAAIPQVVYRGHAPCLKPLVEMAALKKRYYCRDLALAMERSAVCGQLDCLQVLVDAGVSVANSGYEGRMPLLLAAKGGHVNCLELLLLNGAGVNMADNLGNTALIRASKSGHADCVELLIKSGADVNMKSSHGLTALMEALLLPDVDCVKILIKGGADVHIKNAFGETAIALASKYRYSANVLESLIVAGADVNSEDISGRPVIISAISKCSERDLIFLLSSGADVNSLDTSNNTPLIVAAEQNVTHGVNCIKVLLKHNVGINTVNNQNMNALCSHISKCTDWDKPPDRTMVLLLYAAGESLDDIIIDEDNEYIMCVLDYLDKREIQLKELCREVIRQKLIRLYPHKHLFDKVTKLGLPPSLADYMLYNVSLE